MLLHGLASYQLRLRELPQWLVDEAMSVDDPQVRKAARGLQLGIALDKAANERRDCRRMLDEYRQDYGGSVWLDSCDAYYSAVWEGRTKHARSLLWPEQNDEMLRPLTIAAIAAVCAAEGDRPGTRELLGRLCEALAQRDLFEDLAYRDVRAQIEQLIETAGKSCSPDAAQLETAPSA